MLRSNLKTYKKTKNKTMLKKFVRKVTRVGKRSLSINIPMEIVRELGIRERQKLTVRRSGSKIIIEDWEK